MILVMNFRPWDREGSNIRGFFDLHYHELTICGCRLMSTRSGAGLWISLPQREIDPGPDGVRKWVDIISMSGKAAKEIRAIVIEDLIAQGLIDDPRGNSGGNGSGGNGSEPARPSRVNLEGEDLGQYYTRPEDPDDDIPF